ncbi:helix-turn-helix domain-containing protein [Thalassotalea marina]|uniref:HTH cro/C1-type domain-containing protein n=1 Tax=Thalassotalea marina TaxID=1673741 RepID=A0A919EH57_9GAMM|nr:helix-turn-helix transcriptional regulator [Thalassotalea marina]GHF79294.1 hypothetical protein GCM10017161_03080 [Thalassotalea marina]
MEVNAAVIKQLRTEQNWTQQHLADACGLSLRTIQRVERYGNTSNETLMALASVFQVEKTQLIAPEQLVEVIGKTESLDKNQERVLIVKGMFCGLLLGVFITVVLQYLMNI